MPIVYAREAAPRGENAFAHTLKSMHLRFACQPGCTKCCEVQGYVYITEENLRQMAAYVGLSAKEFEAKYVVRFRKVLRLRKPRGRQCHFLSKDGCAVHPVKPVQCRLYPFWPELVESRSHWQKEQRMCPGIGKGELIQIGEACEKADEMKTAYPAIYEREIKAKALASTRR